MYAAAAHSGLLPSLYQRPDTLLPGLKAAPVWAGMEIPEVVISDKDRVDIMTIINKGTYSALKYVCLSVCLLTDTHELTHNLVCT